MRSHGRGHALPAALLRAILISLTAALAGTACGGGGGGTESPPASPPASALTASEAPAEVSYGTPVSFRVREGVSTGPVAGLDVVYGPVGMSVDATGRVTWTPTGPMFDHQLDVHWRIGKSSMPAAGDVQGTIRVRDPSRRLPVRRLGSLSPQVPAGLLAEDLDADGVAELLVGDWDAIQEVARQPDGSYDAVWAHPFALEGIALAARDVDGDGRSEIFVAGDRSVVRLSGARRVETGRGEVPDDLSCIALAAADTDLDGAFELVCLAEWTVDRRALIVFDATTFEIEWRTPLLALGGALAVANIDPDPALEIATSGGFVYDGVSHNQEWVYSPGFGKSLAAGDIDGDGRAELVGGSFFEAYSLRAFDGETRALLWETGQEGVSSVVVADVTGDAKAEIVAGSRQGTAVDVYRHEPAGAPALVASLGSPDFGIVLLAAGDLDGDGVRELAWTAGANSGAPTLTVANVQPQPALQWTSPALVQLDGFVGGHQGVTAPGRRSALFAVASTNDGRGGSRLVALDGDGTARVSADLGLNLSRRIALDVADLDGNGIDEAFLATHGTSDGYFNAVDFESGQVAWTSPRDLGSGRAVAHADLNDDGHPDFIAITVEGVVYAYDVFHQALLWQSADLGQGWDLGVGDLDGDGRMEILVVAASQAGEERLVGFAASASGGGFERFASRPLANFRDLAVGDVDGDGRDEAFVLHGGYYAPVVARFGAGLQAMGSIGVESYAVADDLGRLVVEEGGGAVGRGRRNLLITVSGAAGGASIVAIDPRHGAEVWRSPALPGHPVDNGLHFVDLDDDGTMELALALRRSMLLTR